MNPTIESPAANVITERKPKPTLKTRYLIWCVKKAAGISHSRKRQPILEKNSLSIIERHFAAWKENTPQVILLTGYRVSLPVGVFKLSITRLKEILKLAAARHYRACSYVDVQDFTVKLLSDTAEGLPVRVNFTPFENASTHEKVIYEAVNYQYDFKVIEPIWKLDIVGLPEIANGGLSLQHEVSRKSCPEVTFIFSANHCFGDGLGILSLAKTFLSLLTIENLNCKSLNLDKITVDHEPPPLLDNYIDPGFFEILRRKV